MRRHAISAVQWGRLFSIGASAALVAALGAASSGGGWPSDLSLTTSSCAASWPMYQHDPAHSGTGCSTVSRLTISTLRPSWFVATAGPVTAEPVVAGGSVFVGDSSGVFHALTQATGSAIWSYAITTPVSCYLDQPAPYADQHRSGFGLITSTANVTASVHADRAHLDSTVFFSGGATLYAFDARTGACDWAQDVDPGAATSSVEVESSPVVDLTATRPDGEVLVGSDDNSGPGHGVTGLQAFDATTGALLWRYEPERDVTLYPSEFGGSDALALSCGDGSPDPYCTSANVPGIAVNSTSTADACGDVWSSPVLDTSFVDPAGDNAFDGNDSYGQANHLTDPNWFAKQITASGSASADGLVLFGTGNCGGEAASYSNGDYAHAEGLFALDPATGVRVWNWFEPANIYNTQSPNEGGAGDDDFGGSAVLDTVPVSAFGSVDPCPVAAHASEVLVQGGKSGHAYGLCAATGHEIWGVQAAEPGQLSPSFVGAVGGFIGSPSVGSAKGQPAAFFDAAIFLPLADDGVRFPGSTDDAGALCPGPAGQSLPLLAACPDFTLANDPTRVLSLQAIDVATGAILWRAAQAPSYAATTYANGVVFAASTTTGTDEAYDADTGLPLWRAPLLAAGASGNAIVGSKVFVGSGLLFTQIGPAVVPPGESGIWCFDTASGAPTIEP